MSEDLKYRLQDYEVALPPDVWSNVCQELNEINELLLISQKLYDFEVNPPETSWQVILADLLQVNAQSSQAPVKKLNKRIFTMVASAAVLGVILVGSLYLVNNISSKARFSGKQLDSSGNDQNKTSKPLTVLPQNKRDNSISQQMNASISDNIINKQKNKLDKDTDKILRNTIIKNVRSFGSELGVIIKPKPIRNDKGYIIQNLNLMNLGGNEYISITGPNGQQTKISAKFLNVLLYMNDDSNIEQFEGYFSKNFMESLVWKSRFKEWRNKLIQTSIIPSPGNFMDILEFKDLIIKDKENQ